MNPNEIIQLAAEAGKIILENGGETYRVEQTISIICSSYNLPTAESFVTPTGIIISMTDKKNKTFSIVKRIERRTVNFEKVAKVNELSRLINQKPLPIHVFRNKLKKIDCLEHYSNRMTSFFSAVAAGSFTLLFGGNIRDFIVSCFVGFCINRISILLSRLEINSFFINMSGGSMAALIALSSVYFGIGMNEDKIIIGSIMLLVPGLAITNAVRDTIAGDLVSGISRTIEAFFIAIAIAIGTGVTFNLWFKLFGGV